MSEPNFSAMNKAELRAYAIAHPDDKEAFYALSDLLTANPSSTNYSAQMTPEEINQAVLERIEKMK